MWRLVRYKTLAVTLAATVFVLAMSTPALLLRSGSGWLGSVATAIGSVWAMVIAASELIRRADQLVNKGLAKVDRLSHRIRGGGDSQVRA
ncbi:hypothetical protein BWI15_12260 [Kribbella sp. ALI-6-A]|nr:hypothetical protein BWI15_12260 [Kribbella sp. ALI-6-A]